MMKITLQNLPINTATLFKFFKYLVYVLLTFNVWIFFQDDYLASQAIYPNGIALEDLISTFSAFIDTASWVLLIWLFELETAVIPDDKLKGSLKWWLMGVRALCYIVIVYAFVGYIGKYFIVSDVISIASENVCGLVDKGYAYIANLGEYPALTADVCQSFSNQPLVQIQSTQIIGTVEASNAAILLAIVDAINSSVWLLIILALELDVYVQLRGLTTSRYLKLTSIIKGVLYLLLLACCIYWGILGDFIDFWDSFLWIVAFVFIELNIFNWREEGAVPSQE